MGLFDRKKSKKKKPQEPAGPSTLAEDIAKSCDWIVEALNASGYRADYTLESMKEIDRFYNEQNGPDGILGKNLGTIIFALGSYVGETVIQLYGGQWLCDDSDPEGEVKITVELANGSVIFPVMRCMKRFHNGAEDSIYAYVYALKQ